MNKKLGIHFGVLGDSISEQLTEQGFKFNSEDAQVFDEIKESLNSLYLFDMITDSQLRKLEGKLYNKIVNHVMKENKLEKVKN